MPEFANRLDAIPLVSTTAERGTLFPTPSTGQRVQNLETGAIERYTGSAWATTNVVSGTITPQQYGAVGDGATNDAAALTSAINACLSSGATLYIPKGQTFYLSSWTAITTTAALSIAGEGTIQYAGSTQVAFLRCPYNVELDGVTFTGWFRVIDNETGVVSTAVDWVRVRNCRFLNAKTGASNFAYSLLIQNACENVLIANCQFKTGLYTAFQIGDNSYTNQDLWKRIVIRDNVVDGISMQGSTAAVAYGFLVYGRDVTIEGNHVTNVDGPTAASSSSANGASGIYTKARYNQIRGNRVTNIGNAVLADSDQVNGIHIKGADRSVAASSPQGYDVVCDGNVVLNIGVSNTRGYGIAALHSDVLITGNIVEETGIRGILFADAVTGATGSIVITDNIVRHASGASYNGIDVVGAALSMVTVADNIIQCPNIGINVRNVTNPNGWAFANVVVSGNQYKGSGIMVQLSATDYALSNVSVTDNLMVSGTYGVYFATPTNISDVMVHGNDFSVASTAAISGTAGAVPATARIRNNRGYVSEKHGVTSAISTGTTVAHGCSATPTVILVTALDSGPTDIYITSIGATNFTINYGGGGTHTFAWQALTANHYA